MQVSINNGSSYLSSSGDYIIVDNTGTETNATALTLHVNNATTVKSGSIVISGWNLTDPKIAFLHNRAVMEYIPTANDLDALRIFPSAGGNITGGSIFVYGR
jgi:hypothetical protein